jgi:ABC-2 type transport system ATP-binding protein
MLQVIITMSVKENCTVSVSKLAHRYATQWAVKDIDLELAERRVYGLLGANGAGKSTIMNIICGVLRQTQGDVIIKGVNLKDDAIEAKKHIGFLPQKAPLMPELNVEEYLTFSAHLRRIPSLKVHMAVREVMEKVGITHFRKRLIGNLSGGYQQRVGIAQAIIHHPDLVVLDEPTNGLDPNQIIEIRNLIKEIAQERTVILSTHILQEVQAVCDHIWMINNGQIVFSGTINEFDSYSAPDSMIISLQDAPPIEEIMKISAVREAEHLGGTKYRLRYSDYLEVTGQIVQMSINQNWKLTEMRPEKNSLDSIFMELSKKNTN